MSEPLYYVTIQEVHSESRVFSGTLRGALAPHLAPGSELWRRIESTDRGRNPGKLSKRYERAH